MCLLIKTVDFNYFERHKSANYKKRFFNSLVSSINKIDHRRLDMPHLVSYIKHCLHIWPEVMPRPIDKVSFQQGNENCSIKYIFGMMLYVIMAKIKKLCPHISWPLLILISGIIHTGTNVFLNIIRRKLKW